MSKQTLAKNENEKTIGLELKKVMKALEDSREASVQSMAETISLAADAGDLILSAETEGLNVLQILEVGGVSDEQARRLKRVAGARPSLSSPKPGELRQLALWSGILPDPIETTKNPRPEPHWLAYIFKAQQWIARKSPDNWTQKQKEEFVREAKPIAEMYVKAGGLL